MKIRVLAAALALLALLALTLAGCKKDPEPEPEPAPEDEGPTLYASGAVEGSALTWEFYDDGTLYIKGTGAMDEDYITKVERGTNEQPWGKYASKENNDDQIAFTKAVVEDGVTGLSQLAFKHCTSLREVTFGQGITAIPFDCFAGCTALTKVAAKSATVIGENAFQDCKNLTMLTVSASIAEVQWGAFSGAGTFTLSLAGTEEEWNTAKAALTIADRETADNANTPFITAMERPRFVQK